MQWGSSPCLVGDGPGCTSTGSEVVVSLMTVAGGGGGGGSSASSASSASVGVGGGNGYNLTPMGDSVGATFSLCRESGERIGVACRVRRGWSVRKRDVAAGAGASAGGAAAAADSKAASHHLKAGLLIITERLAAALQKVATGEICSVASTARRDQPRAASVVGLHWSVRATPFP